VRLACAAVLGACLVLAACGDDDEPAETGTAPTETEAVTETAPETETAPPTPTEKGEPPPQERPPPEEQPGGAGDEEAIRSEARLTGNGGRVQPDTVSVPPFIGVRVFLRSEDGARYGFRCAGRRVQVDRDVETASTTLPGQRAGTVVPCRALGDHNNVLIRFSAEPGP
jgi:hypothetical protein